MAKRPVAVWIVCGLYLLVGIGGLVGHFPELMRRQPDSVLIELTELLAIVAAAAMWRGQNWGRWLAVAWMALHVAISFPEYREMGIHLALLAGIAWAVFGAHARGFFAGEEGVRG